jgi:hypothetical protein
MIGAGGAGAVLLTERGRAALRGLLAKLESAPAQWDDWSESGQDEIGRIQSALERIARTLEPHGDTGR